MTFQNVTRDTKSFHKIIIFLFLLSTLKHNRKITSFENGDLTSLNNLHMHLHFIFPLPSINISTKRNGICRVNPEKKVRSFVDTAPLLLHQKLAYTKVRSSTKYQAANRWDPLLQPHVNPYNKTILSITYC